MVRNFFIFQLAKFQKKKKARPVRHEEPSDHQVVRQDTGVSMEVTRGASPNEVR